MVLTLRRKRALSLNLMMGKMVDRILMGVDRSRMNLLLEIRIMDFLNSIMITVCSDGSAEMSLNLSMEVRNFTRS